MKIIIFLLALVFFFGRLSAQETFCYESIALNHFISDMSKRLVFKQDAKFYIETIGVRRDPIITYCREIYEYELDTIRRTDSLNIIRRYYLITAVDTNQTKYINQNTICHYELRKSNNFLWLNNRKKKKNMLIVNVAPVLAVDSNSVCVFISIIEKYGPIAVYCRVQIDARTKKILRDCYGTMQICYTPTKIGRMIRFPMRIYDRIAHP